MGYEGTVKAIDVGRAIVTHEEVRDFHAHYREDGFLEAHDRHEEHPLSHPSLSSCPPGREPPQTDSAKLSCSGESERVHPHNAGQSLGHRRRHSSSAQKQLTMNVRSTENDTGT